MVELLAALSASAAAGMRIFVPLLVISLLQGNSIWSGVPLLSGIPQPVVLGLLTSLSLIELFASKSLLGQRLLQPFQLLFSPIVGAIIGIAVVQSNNPPISLVWIIGIVSSLFALLLQLSRASWFYRLRGLPLWFVFVQDTLCIALVVFALYAPQIGGLIALILLWLAVRSFKHWQHLDRHRSSPSDSKPSDK